ncbi:MAG: hypothetical protein K9L17_06495 [Clostridiales bacterium]|nr:hypothetical protein [Clostridiales bacterium]MCF8022321.1 hypothetical protein [Clostridiales bacterium]
MTYILVFFAQGITEALGLVALCFAIARVPFSWKKIFLFSILLTIISYTMQALSFSFGLHTVVILLITIFYLSSRGNIKIIKSFWVTLMSFFALAILELIANAVYFKIIGLNAVEVTSNNIYWPILGIPQAIIIFMIALVARHFFKPEQEI